MSSSLEKITLQIDEKPKLNTFFNIQPIKEKDINKKIDKIIEKGKKFIKFYRWGIWFFNLWRCS